MKKISALLLAVVPLFLFAQPSFSEFELYHYLDLGKELYDQGKYDAAIDEFNMLIRRDPQNLEAYQYRGNAYFRTRRYNEAIKDYDLAIELTHRQARENDFMRYKKNDIREIDIIEPENSKDQDIAYAMLYNNRGAAKYHTGRYEDAIRDFEQAGKISPDLSTAKDNADRASNMASRYASRYNDSRYNDSRYQDSRYQQDNRYQQDSRYQNDRYYNNDSRNSRYIEPRSSFNDQMFKIEDQASNYSNQSNSSRYNDDRRYSSTSRQSDDFRFTNPSTYNSSSDNSYSRNNTNNTSTRNTSDRYSSYSRNTRPYQPTKIEDLNGRTPRYESKYDSKSSNYAGESTYKRYEPSKNTNSSSVANRNTNTSSRNTTSKSGRTTVSDWWKARRAGQNNSKNEVVDRNKNSNRRRESLFGSKSKSYTYKNVEVKGQTARYVKIESIVNEEKSTMVHFKLTNYEREPLRLFLERPNDEGAYFITDADTRHEYRMIRAYGLNLRPYETIIEVGQSISFSIEFERIDDKTKRIHILEGNYETDTRWNFYDVRLK